MLDLFVDIDACPVSREMFMAGRFHGLDVYVVTRGHHRIPVERGIRLILAEDGSKAADDWIADHIGMGDVCVTVDTVLAARCLLRGAQALHPDGLRYSTRVIGEAISAGGIVSARRHTAMNNVGSPPLPMLDRARFARALEAAIQSIRATLADGVSNRRMAATGADGPRAVAAAQPPS